jgi:hypothetical protein
MPIQKITSGIIQDGAIVAAEIADGTVTTAKIASNVTLTTPTVSGNLNFDTTGTLGIQVPSANTLAFYTAGTEDIRITSNGDVGIGTTTPAALSGFNTSRKVLQVTPAGGTGSAQLRLGGTSGTMLDHNDEGNTITTLRNIYGATNQNAAMQFQSGYMTFGVGTSYTEAMRVNTLGNLLLGSTNDSDLTSSQAPKLAVSPASSASTGIANFPVGLAVRNGVNPASSGHGIAIKFHFSGGEAGKYAAIAGVADSNYSNSTALGFYTNPNGTSGADNNALRMYIGGGGSIGAPSGTNIYNASDVRLKKNINDLPVGLAEILQLRPISYNWKTNFCKEENDKLLYGFIAQETQTVDETLIESFGNSSSYYDDEEGEKVEVTNPLRVNEKFIVPMLVKAIQEQQTIIEQLKSRLDAAGL